MHRSQQARAGRALTTGWGEGAPGPDAPAPAPLGGPVGAHAPPPDGAAPRGDAAGGTVPRGDTEAGTFLRGDAAGGTVPHRRARGLLAEIALLLALVLALPPLLVGGTPAETVARRFLQALVDGDVATVQEHLTAPGDALDLALDPAVIAATGARIEGFDLLTTRIEDGRAEVHARLRVGGRSLTTTLHLELRRESAWPRPAWALVPLTLPTGQVAIPVGSSELRLNGQRVTVPADRRPLGAAGLGIITLRVLPGLYEIEALSRDARLHPVAARVNVPPLLSPWTSVPLQVGYALTDSGRDQLADALRDSLAQCLCSSSPSPAGCPLDAAAAHGLPGSWELVAAPEIRVSAGWMGTYTVYARGGVAEFTVPVEGGRAPRTHRVLVDARAVGVLGRDGELATSWST